MYIIDDIWNHIKTFMFKTIEMKKYDVFVTHFNNIRDLSFRLFLDNKTYEAYIYNTWAYTKKMSFFEKHVYQKKAYIY